MKKFNFALLVLSALLIISLSACDVNVPSTLFSPSTATIQVSGNGSVIGEPDMATLNLGVSVLRKTVAVAREDAASAMTAVVESLKTNGVAEEDIKTSNFSIYPQYDYTEMGRILRGYNVNNTISAKVMELDTLSKIIDDAAEGGGDSVVINSIQFSIEDPTPLQTQARSLAVKNAEAKARTLAEAGGVTLGKPIAITETTYTSGPPIVYDEAAAIDADAGRTPTPISPGELTVTVNVNVTYEIE